MGAAGNACVCAGGFPLVAKVAVPRASAAKSLQHPQGEGGFFNRRFHHEENKQTKLSWQVNITVCSHVPGAALARLVLFPTDTNNIVVDFQPLAGVLHQCAAVSSFAKGHFSDSGHRELQLKVLNSALGSVSDSNCGKNLTFVLVSPK